MWLFTTCGFFSVVQDPAAEDRLVVRGRVRRSVREPPLQPRNVARAKTRPTVGRVGSPLTSSNGNCGPDMIELAPGVHALGNGKGGHVHAFQLQNGTELTPVDTLFDDDGGLVLQAIERLGRQPRDLKRIVITHGHRSHLGWVAALHRAMGATVHARSWEADIVSGDRPAQPVTILTKQSLKLRPFQLGFWLNRPRHVPSPVSGTLAGGDSFGPLQGAVRARHSPGHLVF